MARGAGPLAPRPGPRPLGPTLDDLLTFYEAEYASQLAASTRYQYHLVLRMVRRELGAVPLAALTPARLRDWRQRLLAHRDSGTVRHYLDVFSVVLTVAVAHGWLPTNPMQEVHKPPIARRRRRALDADEQTRLLRACQRSRSPLLYPLVLLALTTGLRKRDLLRLMWREVDLEQGTLHLTPPPTGAEGVVLLPQTTVAVLRQWQAQTTSPRVFPASRGAPVANVSHPWSYALGKAGLADVHFQDLRQTAAASLLSGPDGGS